MTIENACRRTFLVLGSLVGTVGIGGLGHRHANAAEESVRPWAGAYSGHVGTLELHGDGRLNWNWSTFHPGSDIDTRVEASGRAQLLDGWMRLTIDRASVSVPNGGAPGGDLAASLPSRLYPVRIDARRLLLDEDTIRMALDVANGWGQKSLDVQFALQLRNATYEATRAVPVPVVALVPPAEQRFLHAIPLIGRVVAIRDLVPASGNKGNSATLDLDIGAEHGVFLGMTLFSGPRQARGSMVVTRVDSISSSARFIWFTDGPQSGTPVSTAHAT